MHNPLIKKIGLGILIIFALIGAGFISIYFAVKWGWTNTSGIIDTQRDTFIQSGKQDQHSTTKPINQPSASATSTSYWQTTQEWTIVKTAIIKDQAVINRAALTAGVSPRLIVSQLVVEQLRLFFSERESYKQFFEPLKILGSQTQFSWGVMGTKPETAVVIEAHLKDPTSPFYLGPEYVHLLDFHTTNVEQERFVRMTDQHNHFGSYLYAGLYLHEVMNQWKASGYDISKRPDILSTLYNIGFVGSKPNANPQSGGAAITIGDRTYSFGALAQEFYSSNELVSEFPKEAN